MTGFGESGFGLMIQRARLMARENYRANPKLATLKCDCPFIRLVIVVRPNHEKQIVKAG